MILLACDVPFWLPFLLPFLGFILGYGIAALIVGGLAAAGATAYGAKAASEGNWPWTDPEGWFTGFLKAQGSGLGQVISAAQGEDTLVEQLKKAGVGTSREGGTAGEMQGATGQGPMRAMAAALQQTPEQVAQGGGRSVAGPLESAGTGGAARYDAIDAAEGPSRSDILKGAWKDIGIGAGISGASIASAGLGSALLGPAAGAGTAAATGAASGAPAVPSALAGTIGQTIPQGVGQTIQSSLQTALDAVRTVPQTIGNSVTGVLQQGLGQTGGGIASSLLQGGVYGAGKGALSAALQGQDPGRGALSGLAGGAVSSGLSTGLSPFMPTPEATFSPTGPPPLNQNTFSLLGPRGTAGGISHSLLGQPAQPFGMQMGPPQSTFASTLAGAAPGPLGGLASSAVQQAMAPPMPPAPPEPVYKRATYADVFDINGGPYGTRPPYYGAY